MAKQVIVEITGAGPQGPPGEKGATGETGAEGPQGEKGLNGVNGIGVQLAESYHAEEETSTQELFGEEDEPVLLGTPDSITFTVPPGGRTVGIQIQLMGKNPGAGQGVVSLFIDGAQAYNEREERFRLEFGSPMDQRIYSATGQEPNIATANLGEPEKGTQQVGDVFHVFLPEGTHTAELRFANGDQVTGGFKERRLVVTLPGPVTVTGLTWRGEWKTATLYKVNDAVSNKGSSYVSVKEHESFEPPNATYWNVLAEAGEGGGGGGGTMVQSFIATEEKGPASRELMPTPDEVTVTVPEGGAIVRAYASVEAKNPGAGSSAVILIIDGNEARNVGGSVYSGSTSQEEYHTLATGANFFDERPENEGVAIGPGYAAWLPAGEHNIALWMESEDHVNGKFKNRRLVAVVD